MIEGEGDTAVPVGIIVVPPPLRLYLNILLNTYLDQHAELFPINMHYLFR